MTNASTEHLSELGSAAAGIAHDLNNQLILILNYLEISNLEGARKAAGRCSALTGSLLSWCRGEALHKTLLNVNSFLLDFADNIHLPDTVTLRVHISEIPVEIEADALALTRILTNLVNNACDAMDGMGSVANPRFRQHYRSQRFRSRHLASRCEAYLRAILQHERIERHRARSRYRSRVDAPSRRKCDFAKRT